MTVRWLAIAAVAGASFGVAPAAARAEDPSTWSAPASFQDPIAEGLFWLYQLQYDRALACFERYRLAHPEDPAGPFYKAGTDWWHLAQNFDFDLPEIRKRFYDELDLTIALSKKSAESSEDPKVKARAYLYRGGAEGLRGRWLVTQRQWVKAYFAGKNGHHFLELALRYDPTLYDAYMGLGIYDYFTDTMGGVQRALAALLIRGDRKRGIQELETAIEKGDRARVEAMIFLIEIYTSEEKTPQKAIPLTNALRKEFPNSPMAHLAQIMTLYGMQRWEDVVREAQLFIDRSRRQERYYTRDGVRPGLYCLGTAELWGTHDRDAAFRHFEEILAGGIDASRWVTFAFLRRGQIYDLRGEREKAVADYKTVLSRADFWGSHREAKASLAKPLTLQK